MVKSNLPFPEFKGKSLWQSRQVDSPGAPVFPSGGPEEYDKAMVDEKKKAVAAASRNLAWFMFALLGVILECKRDATRPDAGSIFGPAAKRTGFVSVDAGNLGLIQGGWIPLIDLCGGRS